MLGTISAFAYRQTQGNQEDTGKPRSRCRWNDKMGLKEQDGKGWSGFFWLRTGTHGGNSFKAFCFYTMRGIS